MQVRFWGVRGSIPSPQTNRENHKKLETILELAIEKKLNSKENINQFIHSLPFYLKNNYGGNTTCLEVNDNSGNIYILDAGTGLRNFGLDYLNREKKPKKIHIFMTHFHWDHVQGFPFFIPAYFPDTEIFFYSTNPHLEEIFINQQNKFNFPKQLNEMPSKKHFIIIDKKNKIMLNNMSIECFHLNHPGGSTAYKFTENNKNFIFTGDVEFVEDDIENINRFKNFFDHTDIAVFDSQYTLEESFSKFDWGHTTYTMGINLAVNWHIKKLILTHFDPLYSDETISSIEKDAINHVIALNEIFKINIEVQAAYEGLILKL